MTCGGAILKRSWNRKYVGGEMRLSFPNCRCNSSMISTGFTKRQTLRTHVPLKKLNIVMESHMMRAKKKRAAKAAFWYSL